MKESALERAIHIAVMAHKGQVDRGGAPYILHPLRVMFNVKKTEEKIVAVLHDVVEDGKYSFEYLEKEAKFSKNIIKALKLLTRDPKESRVNNAKRILSNPIARVVKLADVNDNMDLSRINNITEKDYIRQHEYFKVKKILTGEIFDDSEIYNYTYVYNYLGSAAGGGGGSGKKDIVNRGTLVLDKSVIKVKMPTGYKLCSDSNMKDKNESKSKNNKI